MKLLKGLWTALVTPFKGRDIDLEGYKLLINRQIEARVDGILILGTTGESPTLSEIEKETLIAIAVEEIAGRIPLLVGTGTYSTDETIKLTKQAQNLGATAALLITPYYNCPTQEGIYRHFAAVSEAIDIPMCLYNNPSRTGREITIATVSRIAQLPGFIGIKECSGSCAYLSELLNTFRMSPNFAILCGDDANALPAMAMGCDGLISVVSNLIPDEIRDLVMALRNGNLELARTYHFKLLPLLRLLFVETNPIPIKAALDLLGLPAGPCRLPLSPLLPHHEAALKKALEEFELFSMESCKSL